MGITVFTSAPVLADEEQRSHIVRTSGILAIAQDPDFRAIVDTAKRSFKMSIVAITVMLDDWQHVVVSDGLDAGVYNRRTSFCGHAIGDDAAIFCIPDATDDARFADNPWVEGENGIRFYAGAPLVVDDMPIGTLCLVDHVPHADFSPADRSLLRALADRVVALLAE